MVCPCGSRTVRFGITQTCAFIKPSITVGMPFLPVAARPRGRLAVPPLSDRLPPGVHWSLGRTNMTPEAIRSKSGDNDMLPALPFDSWKDTLATLHMWSQIVGKVRLKLCPLVNHWWNVPFYITARGMTTSAMPYEGRAIEVQFDFIEHKIVIETSDGRVASMAMEPQSVADFYKKFMATLSELDVSVHIWTMPCEVRNPTPFEQDTAPAAYDADAGRN